MPLSDYGLAAWAAKHACVLATVTGAARPTCRVQVQGGKCCRQAKPRRNKQGSPGGASRNRRHHQAGASCATEGWGQFMRWQQTSPELGHE
jgi:hypothetical protein